MNGTTPAAFVQACDAMHALLFGYGKAFQRVAEHLPPEQRDSMDALGCRLMEEVAAVRAVALGASAAQGDGAYQSFKLALLGRPMRGRAHKAKRTSA